MLPLLTSGMPPSDTLRSPSSTNTQGRKHGQDLPVWIPWMSVSCKVSPISTKSQDNGLFHAEDPINVVNAADISCKNAVWSVIAKRYTKDYSSNASIVGQANDGNDRDADPSSASSSTSLPSFPPPIDNLASPASSFFVEYGAPFRSEGTSPLLSISPGPVPSFGATIHSAPSFTVESSVWLDGTGPGLPAPPRSNALFPSPIMMPTAPIPHLPTGFNPWHTSLHNWPSSVDAGLAQGQEFRSGMPQLSWEGDLAQTARVSDPTLLSTAGPFSAADQSAPATRRLEPGASEPRMEWAEQNPLHHPQAPFPSAGLAEWRHDFDVPELDQRVPSSSAGATLPEEGQTGDLPQASSSPADPNPVPEWPTPNAETLEFDDWEYWGEWLEQDPAYLNFDDLFN
ncbi:uncharacterized protein EI90DRAFT_3151605 [Cantharellus anzutake]|uniref:uncharacterized protein n=1 Tax=Cantharellus anzutake TaxID=1750568 RepID=UPI0019070A64|nr:uncharacterized protein EI90DRAFT_3151605 [Cantharellus anzutake]KAF8339017.1 hypothetical protein EI90DRAFT_3151605 [Cantharellus anzutake]